MLGALLLEVVFRDFVADASGAARADVRRQDDRLDGRPLRGHPHVRARRGVHPRVRRRPGGNLALGALTLGLIVGAAFLVAFPLTGAALNLSRVFGTALVANEWTDFGWYALGMLGGAVAGFVYEYVFQAPEEVHEEAPAEAQQHGGLPGEAGFPDGPHGRKGPGLPAFLLGLRERAGMQDRAQLPGGAFAVGRG